MALPGILQGVVSFAESTSYDEFSSEPEQTTTSNGWVEAARFTVLEERDAGIFDIQWSMKATQTKGGRDFGIQISFREGDDTDANAWVVINSISDLQVPSDNASILYTGFKNQHLDNDAMYQIRVEFGQTVNGGTAKLSGINVVTFRVGDLP